MTIYLTAAIVCVVLAAAMVFLLRTRRIREKYAAVWILLTLCVVLLGVFPQLAFWLSDVVGVQTPVNLVFAVAIVVLLAVCVQLSTEVTNLEEETRTLAEEIALLRLDVRVLAEKQAAHGTAVPEEPEGAAGAEPAARPAEGDA